MFKKWKKSAAILLSVCLTLMPAAGAFAENGSAESETGFATEAETEQALFEEEPVSPETAPIPVLTAEYQPAQNEPEAFQAEAENITEGYVPADPAAAEIIPAENPAEVFVSGESGLSAAGPEESVSDVTESENPGIPQAEATENPSGQISSDPYASESEETDFGQITYVESESDEPAPEDFEAAESEYEPAPGEIETAEPEYEPASEDFEPALPESEFSSDEIGRTDSESEPASEEDDISEKDDASEKDNASEAEASEIEEIESEEFGTEETENEETETEEIETEEPETEEIETEESETEEYDIDGAKAISLLHKAASKKGLISDQYSLDDLVNMGVKNTTITWNIYDHNRAASLLTKDGDVNPYGLRSLKDRVRQFNEKGIVVYLILVLPNYAPELLRWPDSDNGPYYAAWNTSDDEGIEIYENLMETLAEEISQYVSHWIIGNEVNDNIQWHYMGPADIDTHVKEYAKLFRLCYDAIRSYNTEAQVYIPVDHRWKQRANTKEKYDTKDYLDKFDAEIKKGGNIDWCLAFHAYSIPLSAPEVWDDGSAVYSYKGQLVSGGGEISNHEESFAISMKNIDVLTNYFATKISKNTKGKVRPIALTEQGYTSYSERTNKDAAKEQALSIAYGYNKAVSNNGIECFILSREIDAQEMGISYYKFGLSSASGKPKYSHEFFRRLGTNSSLYKSAALPVITAANNKGKKTGTLKLPKTVGSSWQSFYNTAVRDNNNISLSTAATNDRVIAMQLSNYNASGTPYFCVTATVNGCSGTGSALLRLYSDEKVWESEVSGVTVGDEYSFLYDVSGWAGLGKLTGAEFWIRNFTGNGSMSVSPLTASASNATNAPKVLPAVSGLKAVTAGEGKVTVSWNKTDGAIGYMVLRGGKQIKYLNGTSYTDTGASPTSFNFYWVIPVLGKNSDGSIIKGKLSNYVYAVGRSLGQVTGLKASGGSRRVSLSWNKVSGANAYVILSKTGSNKAAFNKSIMVTSNSYIDTNVKSGSVMYYWVYAVYNVSTGTITAGKVSNFAWAVPK